MKVLKYKEGFLYRTPSGAVAEYILHETGCLLFRCVQTSITHVFTIGEAYDVKGHPRFEEVVYSSLAPVLQEDGSYKIETVKHKYSSTDESNNYIEGNKYFIPYVGVATFVGADSDISYYYVFSVKNKKFYYHIVDCFERDGSTSFKQVIQSHSEVDTEQKHSPSSKHSHYFKDVSKLDKIDVYSVLALFEVTDPCIQHAVKKLLCTGNRGHKDFNKDVQDSIDSLQRCLELRKELGLD